MRYPLACFSLAITISIARAQEASPIPSPGEAESEPIVVSATRFDIPLDQSPASVSVITSEDFEQKQIERVSDALREVPGLNVVQTGTPGQLTSVFMRGLPSQDMQVLLNGIPINQGLAGQFDFANLTTDDIDRIEVVRGPQSTLYGPRALAGVVQAASWAASIIRSAQAGWIPTMRARTMPIGIRLALRTSAGRLTNNCALVVCLSIRKVRLETPTRSSIRNRSIIS
jgi:outer membrane cobalamin receptor